MSTRKRQLGLAIAALIVAIYVTIPNFVEPRVASSPNACLACLHYLQRMKMEWAKRVNAGPEVVPTVEDLFGPEWQRRMPPCPAGGTFTIGKVGEKPRCSFGPPHVLE